MNWVVAVPAGLASGVEFVEAFTIVLAVGVTRGWRSALAGMAAAVVVLAVLVLALGLGLLTAVPLDALRVAVGIFLLLFGLKWLRKAILRYSGFKALHDEAETFREEVDRMRSEARDERAGVDWIGSTTSFNGVFLEGLEVVFIVIAVGAGAKAIGSATVGALIAGVIVAAAGALLRHPMERVPENTMKYVVGIMLTSFGTFWTAEGIGVAWWHQDLSLIPLIIGYLVVSWLLVVLLRRAASAPSRGASRERTLSAGA